MTIPSRPTNQDPQSTWLWYILKQLDKLTGITQSSVGGLTNTELRASAVEVNEPSLTDGSQKSQLTDASGNLLYPSGEPVRISATLTRPSDNNSYLAGDHVNSSTSSPAAILLPDAAIVNGGGGFIMDFKMETDATTFAGATLRFWMFNDIPTGIVNDNAPYINSFANADKRCACGYFDCTFDPLLGGSDCVIGKYQPNTEYVCATASKNMYILVQTLTAVSTPKSAGVFKFYFNVVKTK